MTTTQPQHPVHKSLEKHNIRRVAVVDDAFDTVSMASLQEGEDQEFIDAVNDDDTLLREFHKLVSNRDSDELLAKDALTDAAVGLLWDKRAALGALGPVVARTLFRVLELKVSQVEKLCAFLKDDLGIETIERYRTNSEVPNDKFDLAFIDYRFGPSRQQESVDRAVRWAMHLYKNGKAFIILMSVEMEARVQQELFRRKSNLTRGLFEFVDKEEIKDSGKLSNRLNSFCAGFDTRHEIHQFACATESAVDEAGAALKESLHALGLEDFAYLEQISLQEDGHPLGDYMLWLFGEYFAHKLSVSQSLQPARNLVNGLKYERFLPLQRPPSVMLAKMYSSAITEPVHEGWNPHPRDVQETATGPSTQPGASAEAVPPPEGEASVALETAQTPAGGAMAPTETPAPDANGAGASVAITRGYTSRLRESLHGYGPGCCRDRPRSSTRCPAIDQGDATLPTGRPSHRR